MTRKDKALQVIEVLAVSYRTLEDEITIPTNVWDDIYKFVHIANNNCDTLHLQWRKDLEKAYDELKDKGEINAQTKE